MTLLGLPIPERDPREEWDWGGHESSHRVPSCGLGAKRGERCSRKCPNPGLHPPPPAPFSRPPWELGAAPHLASRPGTLRHGGPALAPGCAAPSLWSALRRAVEDEHLPRTPPLLRRPDRAEVRKTARAAWPEPPQPPAWPRARRLKGDRRWAGLGALPSPPSDVPVEPALRPVRPKTHESLGVDVRIRTQAWGAGTVAEDGDTARSS